MLGLAHSKRSTAPSNGMDAPRSAGASLSAPQPRSGAPKAQGLMAALRPQHNPSCYRLRSRPVHGPPISQRNGPLMTIFHPDHRAGDASALSSKLHQLDGGDRFRSKRSPHRLLFDLDSDHCIERRAPVLGLPPIRVLDVPPLGVDSLAKIAGATQ